MIIFFQLPVPAIWWSEVSKIPYHVWRIRNFIETPIDRHTKFGRTRNAPNIICAWTVRCSNSNVRSVCCSMCRGRFAISSKMLTIATKRPVRKCGGVLIYMLTHFENLIHLQLQRRKYQSHCSRKAIVVKVINLRAPMDRVCRTNTFAMGPLTARMAATRAGAMQIMIRTRPKHAIWRCARCPIAFVRRTERWFPVELNPRRPHKWSCSPLTMPSILKISICSQRNCSRRIERIQTVARWRQHSTYRISTPTINRCRSYGTMVTRLPCIR